MFPFAFLEFIFCFLCNVQSENRKNYLINFEKSIDNTQNVCYNISIKIKGGDVDG